MDISYLADTCVLSETSKLVPDPQIIRWIKITPRVLLPVGALVEFEQGIYMKKESNPERFAELLAWRIELMSTGIRFVDTDQRVALKYGEMRACKKLKPLWLPNPDLEVQRGGQDIHIAAAAIVHNYCIATMNVRDFLLIHENFELPGLYDPKADLWHVKPPGLARRDDVTPASGA